MWYYQGKQKLVLAFASSQLSKAKEGKEKQRPQALLFPEQSPVAVYPSIT